MRLFKKIGIVGIGLIGGSLGLAIKKYNIAEEIIGVSRRKKTLKEALKREAVDIAGKDLNILKDVDFIILATPVRTIKAVAPLLLKVVKDDCIITDVGSTKKEIVLKLGKLFPNYIGSHPLAGSQNAGVDFADADMFKNSFCILTPTRNSSTRALSKVEKFWQAVGAKVGFLSPSLHDKILAYTSHLPHLIAFSLCHCLPPSYFRYTAPSFKDTTRIALSLPVLWQDIFMSNRKELLNSLKRFKERLESLENILSKSDTEGLTLFLKRAQEKRKQLL